MVSMSSQEDFQELRTATPTTFTLLSQSGVLHSTYPTSCQLSFTVCALALLTLVAFIVYMEGECCSYLTDSLQNLMNIFSSQFICRRQGFEQDLPPDRIKSESTGSWVGHNHSLHLVSTCQHPSDPPLHHRQVFLPLLPFLVEVPAVSSGFQQLLHP